MKKFEVIVFTKDEYEVTVEAESMEEAKKKYIKVPRSQWNWQDSLEEDNEVVNVKEADG